MPEALSLSHSSLTPSSALKPLHSEYPSHPRLPAVYLQLAVSLFVQFGGSEKKWSRHLFIFITLIGFCCDDTEKWSSVRHVQLKMR